MSLYVPECFILVVKVLDTGMQGLFISLESVNVLENTVIQNYHGNIKKNPFLRSVVKVAGVVKLTNV